METYFSTDKKLLEITKIHQYISNESYWGKERTLEEVQTTIDNSICFGIYTSSHQQIAFARLVTDKAFFAYFMDVIVFPTYQGKGYGKALVQHMMEHEYTKNVHTLALKTKDAHGLYQQFGFKKIGNSPYWMSIDRLKLE